MLHRKAKALGLRSPHRPRCRHIESFHPIPQIDGSKVSVRAEGQLTVNAITRDVNVDLDAQLVDHTIVVEGSTKVTFSDYDVTAPSAAIVLSVDDHGVVEFQLLFSRK